jgi:hypothetical protein
MELKEHKFTPSGKPRVLTDEQEHEIAHRYSSGEGTVVLSREFGCSVRTVSNVLGRRGVKKRRSKPRSPKGFIVDGYRWVPANLENEIDSAMCRIEYPYIAEHRLVMAHFLGRPLLSKEQVHHIDGNRNNNDIGNLQLRQGNHGSGVVMCCGDCGSENVIATRIGEKNG